MGEPSSSTSGREPLSTLGPLLRRKTDPLGSLFFDSYTSMISVLAKLGARARVSLGQPRQEGTPACGITRHWRLHQPRHDGHQMSQMPLPGRGYASDPSGSGRWRRESLGVGDHAPPEASGRLVLPGRRYRRPGRPAGVAWLGGHQ
jgi:hypothetical protein